MPRNFREFAYPVVPLPRNSPVYDDLVQECKRSRIPIGKLIMQHLLRLYDIEHGNTAPIVKQKPSVVPEPVSIDVAAQALGEWE